MGGMLLSDLDLLAFDDEEPRFLAKLEGLKRFTNIGFWYAGRGGVTGPCTSSGV